MKISFSFSSLIDLSNLSKGERLLEILLSHGLIIDKAGDHEPIKKDFITSDFPEMWKGMGLDGECASCYFLFKGKKEINFSGMATWWVNIHPNSKSFNGIDLWLNTPKNYDYGKLVQLGDDIFEWSEAVYGYITEESKDPSNNEMIGNIYDGLPGLLWVNYFGTHYIVEPDFNLPNNHKPISHGVRFMLSETPDDERLNDLNFLENSKNNFGVEWFWSHPRKYNKKVPYFDRSAITRR